MMSTSGICVQSPNGEEYVTVAKHGFPGGVGDLVYHLNKGGHIIAEVSKVFNETDIAIVKLSNGLYSRETFSSEDVIASSFKNLMDVTQLQTMDFVYMDTPFNGCIKGTLIKIDILRLPADKPANNDLYLIGIFSYFGNEADTLFNGCCGGVLRNDNNDVLRHFRFKGPENLCYCPTFDILRGLGYTIPEL